MWDVDITDYTVLGERGLLPGVRTPFLLPGSVMTVTPAMPETTCTGMILHPSFDRAPQVSLVPPPLLPAPSWAHNSLQHGMNDSSPSHGGNACQHQPFMIQESHFICSRYLQEIAAL